MRHISVPAAIPPESKLTDRVYDAVNSGSFAVILVTAAAFIYANRTLKSVVNSDVGRSFLGLVEQIRANQEHIGALVHRVTETSNDVDRLDKTTSDLLIQVTELHKMIIDSGNIGTAQHDRVMTELSNIKSILGTSKE